jgi:hypothetical protein
MNACRERGLERVPKRAVPCVEPVDRYFERKPGVEAGGTRIGQRLALRLRGIANTSGNSAERKANCDMRLPSYRELALYVLRSQLAGKDAVLERGKECVEMVFMFSVTRQHLI